MRYLTISSRAFEELMAYYGVGSSACFKAFSWGPETLSKSKFVMWALRALPPAIVFIAAAKSCYPLMP